MIKKDVFYLVIIIPLLILIGFLYWKLDSLNEMREIATLKQNLNEEIHSMELDELIQKKLLENNVYASPFIAIFESEVGIMRFYIRNNFNETKNFYVQILPNGTSNDYDNILIDQEEYLKEPMLLMPHAQDFHIFSVRIKNPDVSFASIPISYVMNIQTEGEVYASESFLMFPIDKKKSKELITNQKS